MSLIRCCSSAARSIRQRRLAAARLVSTVVLVSLFSGGCARTAEPEERNEACAHFAQIAVSEFPDGDELDEEGIRLREEMLSTFCREQLEQGEDMTVKQYKCFMESATLEAIAVCVDQEGFADQIEL